MMKPLFQVYTKQFMSSILKVWDFGSREKIIELMVMM
jgi:hypothetical protein